MVLKYFYKQKKTLLFYLSGNQWLIGFRKTTNNQEQLPDIQRVEF